MKTLTRFQVEIIARARAPGYLAAMQAAATVEGDSFTLPETVAARIYREHAPRRTGLGDVVERLAKPIARALRMDCLDAQGKLKPQSPCAKRRDWLNNVTKGH